MDSYDKMWAEYERIRALNEQHPVEAWKRAVGYDDLLAAYSRANDALNFLRRVDEGGYILSSAALTPEQIAYARAGDRMFVTEDGLGYVYNAPGDHRELVESLHAERDDAPAKAADYKRDWYEAKGEFGIASAKLRARIRELESERDGLAAKIEFGEETSELRARIRELEDVLNRAAAKDNLVRELIESNGCGCDCERGGEPMTREIRDCGAVMREQADELLRELWHGLRDGRNAWPVVYARVKGAIDALVACGILDESSAELWIRRIETCPGHEDAGGRDWCAYCGHLSKRR